MARYDDDISTAEELIIDSGEVCQLIRYTTVAPDNTKPWRADVPAADTQNVNCVFLNFNLQSSGETYWEGSQIRTGDKKILLSPKGLSGDLVLQAELVRANGEVWKIENFKKLDPNGQIVLFTILGRK